MLTVVTDGQGGEEMRSTLDEIVAEGARRMLAAALEAEVDAYIRARAEERDDDGRRLVVRNGHAQSREVVTGAGPIPVRAPAGERQASRPGHGGTGPLPVLDSDALGVEVAEGLRGVAVDVSPRHVVGRLRPGIVRVLRF